MRLEAIETSQGRESAEADFATKAHESPHPSQKHPKETKMSEDTSTLDTFADNTHQGDGISRLKPNIQRESDAVADTDKQEL